MKKALFILLTASISLFLLIIFTFFKYNDRNLHVIMCDVGQGDAILILAPGGTQILVDGGPDKSVLDCLSRRMPFWDRSIDALILTHPHADHFFGFIDVVDRYKIGGFYTENIKAESDGFKLLEAKLADKKISAKDIYKNDDFRDKSGLNLEIIWPRLDTIKKSDQNITNLDLNGLSVIALLRFGDFSMLFTGDAGEIVLNQIAKDVGDIDVLKTPHHGSKTGMSDEFLKIIDPEFALISVGSKNSYGHPAGKTLKLLEQNKSKIYRTDINGEIEIITDGKTYKINTNK